MYLRRFYRRGVPYKYYISDNRLLELSKFKSAEELNHLDNANTEVVLESVEEEKSWFFDCCNRVLANPRFYLNNLDGLITFKINVTDIFPSMIK